MTKEEFTSHRFVNGEKCKALMWGNDPCEVVNVDLVKELICVRNCRTRMVVSWKYKLVELIQEEKAGNNAEADRVGEGVTHKPVSMRLVTSLAGFKRLNWKKHDLGGYFVVNGQELTDEEVRLVVQYGIDKNYKTDAEIPDKEVIELLRKLPRWENKLGE